VVSARGGCEGPKNWHPHSQRYMPGPDMMLFQLDKCLTSAFSLSQEQRSQVFAILDEARPVLRNLKFELKDQRRALRQLNPAAKNYQSQLNQLATKQAELKKSLIVKMGETKSKVFALLDEQQKVLFLNWQENRRKVW